MGASLGMRHGLAAGAEAALGLLVVLLGVAAVTLPGLYIAAALVGVAPALGDSLKAASRALRDAGLVLLGLSPPVAFLVATAEQRSTVWLLGHAALALAVVLALRTLYRRLLKPLGRPARALPVFLGWAAVAVGIGERLLLGVLSA